MAAVRRRAVLGRAGRRDRRAPPGGGVRGAPGARGGRHRGACRGRLPQPRRGLGGSAVPRPAPGRPVHDGRWAAAHRRGRGPARRRRRPGAGRPARGRDAGRRGCRRRGHRRRGARPCSASWACRSARSTRPRPSSARDPSTSACAWWSTRRACRCGRPPTAASSSTPDGWTPSSPTTPAPCPRSASPSCSPRRRRCSPAIPPLVADAVHAGPRPMPVDDEPVLGRVAGIAGLHVAFTHSGATLGLIAGELVVRRDRHGHDPTRSWTRSAPTGSPADDATSGSIHPRTAHPQASRAHPASHPRRATPGACNRRAPAPETDARSATDARLRAAGIARTGG